MKTNRAAPSAAMLIESMRDIGYTLETALADVVDNSISAGAKTVEILADAGNTPRIGVLDDGDGMTADELMAAMRPGSCNPLEKRSEIDLGRFGLGLKTASFSQCRRLTVVTRCEGVISAAVWDLDFVAAEDDWLVQIPEEPDKIPFADHLGNNGTLILWENLDRIVDQGGSKEIADQFTDRIIRASEHLELVFHRFLAGESGLGKVQIIINNRPLTAFDPFNSRNPATVPGPEEHIKVGGELVKVQCFTLPHHQKVKPAEWEKYAGPDGYLKSQGFYVYRRKRLILHGTWFGLARQMELTKLARVRIDIPNTIDAQWKIDVKKASAHPPYSVRQRLRRIIEKIGEPSKRIYTARGRITNVDQRLPVWNRIENRNEISYRLNVNHPVFDDFVKRLPSAFQTDFHRILELAGSTIPMESLFADLGGTPDRVQSSNSSEDTLKHSLLTTVNHLRSAGISSADIKDMLQFAEPFRSNWGWAEKVLADLLTLKETPCQTT